MRPCLRTDLEPLPVEVDGERLIALRDPQQLLPDTALVQPAALPLLEYFDGTFTLEDMRVDLARRGAGFIGLDELAALAESLDRCFLLENERYLQECLRLRNAFEREPVRPAKHAGAAYPAEPVEARAFLQAMLDAVEPRPAAPLARLIAPHIDLGLGAVVHAHAQHRMLAGGRPDVVVILGVCHAPSHGRFILCPKDFATPLGNVPYDETIGAELLERLGDDLTAELLLQRNEHSVEFQALWLAHLWPQNPPAIVPLLVGSFGDLAMDGGSPAEDPDVEEFIATLRGVLAREERRVVVVASVDFAHLGPQYGHARGLDEAGEKEMEAADRRVLDHIEAGDAEGFFKEVARDGNTRNVCGLAPVYVTLRLGEGRGEIVRYGQGRIDPETGSVVSFAAAAFPD